MSTLRAYTLGFVLSVALTLAAFLVAGDHLRTGNPALPYELATTVLVVLAVVQLFVHLIFFLHLGEERRPRWRLAVLLFALIITGILVGGTLWIMNTLQHQQMQEPPDMFEEENIFPQSLHE